MDSSAEKESYRFGFFLISKEAAERNKVVFEWFTNFTWATKKRMKKKFFWLEKKG